MQEQQPGQVIAPGAPTPEPMAPPAMPEVPQTTQLQAAPQQSVAATLPEQSNPTGQQPMVPLGPESLEYSQVDDREPEDALADMAEGITWASAEYLQHEKDATWFGAYALGAILLGGLVFVITRDVVSTTVVVGAIGGLLFLGSRKPRQQAYRLQEEFVQIGQRAYSLHDFKAFSVDEQSPVLGVTLMPLKRLMPPVVLYVDEAHEEAVVDYIADFLPLEPHKVDAMDSLLRRLRF